MLFSALTGNVFFLLPLSPCRTQTVMFTTTRTTTTINTTYDIVVLLYDTSYYFFFRKLPKNVGQVGKHGTTFQGEMTQ